MSGEKNRMIYSWAYHIHPGKPAWSWVSPPQKWDVWHRNMAMIFAVCCKSAGHNGLSTLHVGVTLFTQDLWNCTLTGQMQLPWHLRYQFNNQGPRLSSVYSLIVICSSNQMKKKQTYWGIYKHTQTGGYRRTQPSTAPACPRSAANAKRCRSELLLEGLTWFMADNENWISRLVD